MTPVLNLGQDSREQFLDHFCRHVVTILSDNMSRESPKGENIPCSEVQPLIGLMIENYLYD